MDDPDQTPANGLFSLHGKTALVTGGARGVGEMCARSLLEHGARVIISSRREDRSAETVGRLAELGRCEAIVADLSSPDGVTVLVEELEARTDALDILVNNAGTTWGAPFEDYPSSAWDKVLRLNVTAPFEVIRALIPLLKAGASADDPARVVNLGSIDGHAVGRFDNFAYPPSKAALDQLTRMMAVRLARHDITVNTLALAPILTEMTSTLIERNEDIATKNPMGRLAQPTDVAGSLVYLTARSGSYVTGVTLPVDGGASITTWGGDDR
jgi:NAD(P)-dependent dehydrogenase (short-subunit alcohol dehydrogenase family)